MGEARCSRLIAEVFKQAGYFTKANEEESAALQGIRDVAMGTNKVSTLDEICSKEYINFQNNLMKSDKTAKNSTLLDEIFSDENLTVEIAMKQKRPKSFNSDWLITSDDVECFAQRPREF